MEHFEQLGPRGFYRPVAVVTFEQAVDLVAAAMKHARSLGCEDLLVDTRGFSGFGSPSTIARYTMAIKWVENAGATLRVAMVVRTEFMDPQKIGTLMAQNRGVKGDVFLEEEAALRWLDERRGK